MTTKDGYILRMHRIPHGIKPDSSNKTGKKKVVFLQHGVLASDFVWVTGSNDNALGSLPVVWEPKWESDEMIK